MALKPETKLRRALSNLIVAVEGYAQERFFGAGGGVDGDDDMAHTPEAKAVDVAINRALRVLEETDPKRLKQLDHEGRSDG